MTHAHPVLDSGTLGRCRRRTVLGGLILTETLHAPRTTIDKHAHARPSLNLVLAGAYGERTGGDLAIHPAATLIVKPAGEPHANQFDTLGARCLLVEFEETALNWLRSASDVLNRPCVIGIGPAAGLVARLISAVRGDIPPVAAQEAVLGCLRHVKGLDARPAAGRPGWLETVREQIRATAPERVRLDELAALADVHPAYLSEAFREAYGVTVTGYLEQLRLERAVRELAGSTEPVGRVALNAGFYDHSHFTRVFQRATQLTPSQFRRIARA